MKSGKTQKSKQRDISRAEVLLSLKNRGLIQQVVESNEKLSNLSLDLTQLEVTRIKAANDTRMSLIKKYLPDVKQTELVGEEGGVIEMNHSLVVEFVDPNS